MRLNKYIASATDLSRRKADEAIAAGRVSVDGKPAIPGQDVSERAIVKLDGAHIKPAGIKSTIIFNKPAGYVVSRNGQGSKTIYDILPPEFHHLQPVGRLDKYSSGLLILTNDGGLANELTHPSRQKQKVYIVTLDKPLTPEDNINIQQGVQLEDGPSKLTIKLSRSPGLDPPNTYEVRMHEGRNRQIRRTFAALGYTVSKLHRTRIGIYKLDDLQSGDIKISHVHTSS